MGEMTRNALAGASCNISKSPGSREDGAALAVRGRGRAPHFPSIAQVGPARASTAPTLALGLLPPLRANLRQGLCNPGDFDMRGARALRKAEASC